jgi:hypothetical protein
MQFMLQRSCSCRSRRRGAIVVLVALLLVAMFGFVALCVDIGWTTLTKSQLQNAADSAAAAGASQLAKNYGAYSIPLQPNRSGLIAAAVDDAGRFATRFGGLNGAGGVSALRILQGDIEFGFMDAAGNLNSKGFAGYPNTISVVARRDGSANAPLNLFFAPILGKKTQSLYAVSSATVYTGLIRSFDPNGGGEGKGAQFTSGDGAWGEGYAAEGDGFHCGLLPLAFNVHTWNSFLTTGLSPDGLPHSDATGAPQIHVYPCPHNAPGNFGLLCIGAWTNSNSDYSNWVLNGPSAADIQYLVDGGFLPVSRQSPKNWKGSPGLRSSLSDDFAAIIGQPRLLPLFEPASLVPFQAASGNGSNTTYRIVGFAGVTVTEVRGSGGNLTISVKPCDVVEPTAVFDPSTVYPAGAEPLTQLKTFTHPAPKFSR